MLTISYIQVCLLILLYRNGAQTHFIDQQGQTAFHIAAKSQNHR